LLDGISFLDTRENLKKSKSIPYQVPENFKINLPPSLPRPSGLKRGKHRSGFGKNSIEFGKESEREIYKKKRDEEKNTNETSP